MGIRTLEFVEAPAISRGVVERPFDLHHEGRVVPGNLWTPEGGSGTRPLVLLGHGGSEHKRVPHLLGLARRLVRHQGFAVGAIDGPGHGDRTGTIHRREWWSRPVIESMIADWQATRAALVELDDVGDGPLGYWGLSMGTIFGVPFVAAEPRVQVAVLGLMKLGGARFGQTAAEITCPVLFLEQLDDELFSRADCLDLFLAIGSTDKRLHANPGAHSAVPVEEIEHSEAFLKKHLV